MVLIDQDPEIIVLLALGLINYALSLFRGLRSIVRRIVIVVVVLPDR